MKEEYRHKPYNLVILLWQLCYDKVSICFEHMKCCDSGPLFPKKNGFNSEIRETKLTVRMRRCQPKLTVDGQVPVSMMEKCQETSKKMKQSSQSKNEKENLSC